MYIYINFNFFISFFLFVVKAKNTETRGLCNISLLPV